MKRTSVLMLAVLVLLCGCSAQPELPDPPPVTAAPATEPAGLYDSSSPIEAQSLGAIKAYPLSISDAAGVVPMGSDMLIFSGGEKTVLTRCTGAELRPAATITLPCAVHPEDAAVQVDENSVSYYDADRKELVFLDGALREASRFSLPQTVSGAPALSDDGRMLYYSTSHALRCIDLETGLDRLLTEMYSCTLIPEAVHCGGTVIACDSVDDEGTHSKIYISTRNGAYLYEYTGHIRLQTHGDSYFAQLITGGHTELVLGGSEHGPTLLTPHTYGSTVFALLPLHRAVLATADGAAASMQLDCYDLQSGVRTSSITLPGTEEIRSVRAVSAEQIWFVRYDDAYRCDALCCWDTAKTPVEAGKSCLSARYSAENPDYFGLAACRDAADDLSRRYGVQIHLWTDATAFKPWDYTLVPEHRVPVIENNLKELERFLALYPEGFLRTAAEQTSSGCIQICLVRSILGNEDAAGAAGEAVGLQYWDEDRNTYLCLSMSHGQLFRNACHEMCHIIDSRVLTYCKAYDDWGKLNPDGFRYTYDYAVSLAGDFDRWLSGDSRAFIDLYATTYPKEDRARIMEYAVEAGNGDYFSPETMQKKLRTLCLGIREAFGLKGTSEALVWEQYLAQPIT